MGGVEAKIIMKIRYPLLYMLVNKINHVTDHIYNEQLMDCNAQLLQYAYLRHIFRQAILTRNVGHTDLLFGV